MILPYVFDPLFDDRSDLLKKINQKNNQIQKLQHALIESGQSAQVELQNKIEKLKDDVDQLEERYSSAVVKHSDKVESLYQKHEIQLLNSFKEIREADREKIDTIKKFATIHEKNLKEKLQNIEQMYQNNLALLRTSYETKISSMTGTISIIQDIAKGGQEALSEMKDTDRELGLIEKEFNEMSKVVESINEKNLYYQFEIDRIKKDFDIYYGKYEEAKRNNSVRALEILREMLKLDKDHNIKIMEKIKLENILQETKEKLALIEKTREILKYKKFDLVSDLDKRLYAQEILITSQKQKSDSIGMDNTYIDVSEEESNTLLLEQELGDESHEH